MKNTTLDAQEAEKFEKLSETWWDPQGPFRPLHMLNPIRLRLLQDIFQVHFSGDNFIGKKLLDIGCGGGLIADPMARLLFDVTGLDSGEKNIRAAEIHGKKAGLDIHFCQELIEEHDQKDYDVILALEVVEHVQEVAFFLQEASKRLKEGGLICISTINRTWKSFVFAKVAAEYILQWLPRGTHNWKKFVKPSEIFLILEDQGFQGIQAKGFHYSVGCGWEITDNLDVNYLIYAEKKPYK